MTDTVERIRFKGEEFILTDGGAIATLEAYKCGEQSYAHLFSDGRVMRFHQQIGTSADIERLGSVEVELDLGDFLGGLFGETWEVQP